MPSSLDADGTVEATTGLNEKLTAELAVGVDKNPVADFIESCTVDFGITAADLNEKLNEELLLDNAVEIDGVKELETFVADETVVCASNDAVVVAVDSTVVGPVDKIVSETDGKTVAEAVGKVVVGVVGKVVVGVVGKVIAGVVGKVVAGVVGKVVAGVVGKTIEEAACKIVAGVVDKTVEEAIGKTAAGVVDKVVAEAIGNTVVVKGDVNVVLEANVIVVTGEKLEEALKFVEVTIFFICVLVGVSSIASLALTVCRISWCLAIDWAVEAELVKDGVASFGDCVATETSLGFCVKERF